MSTGWKVVKFGDVCDFVRGPFGGSLKKEIFVEDGFAVYEQQHAIYNQFDGIRYFIDSGKFDEMKRFEVKPGNLIMSCSGTMGKVAIVPNGVKKGIINQALLLIKPNKNILNTFIKYWMESERFQEGLRKLSQGVAIQNVASVKVLKEIATPLPPLPEQQRIVALLDETFAALTKVHANAERNQVNAREVFESEINAIFENSNGSWEEKKIEEIADIEYGYTDKAKASGKFRYIRITDIDKNGNLDLANKMYIGNFKEAENFLLRDSDLLMARTGATFAKVLLYEDHEPSVFASYLIRIKFTKEILNKVYWYFSKSKMYWDQANKLSSGSAQPQFNGNALKQLVFRYPKSLAEQRAIIERLDALAKETRRLEEVYRSKVEAVEELRKSVLSKAFNGEL